MAQIPAVIVQPKPTGVTHIVLTSACGNAWLAGVELGWAKQKVLVLGGDCSLVQLP